MVHWPTKARNDLLGVPGVWTGIQMLSGLLSCEILDGLAHHG